MWSNFFDINSNYINKLCITDECILFADDTALTYVHHDLKYLLNHVNNRLKIILDWCRFNKLSINPTKSEFMIITNRNIDITPKLYLGDDEISKKRSVKYLGLYIDDGLRFQTQLHYLKTKLSRIRGISTRICKNLNLQTATTFYYAFVYSTITYCISVWGGALHHSYISSKLDKVHQKIVKNLFKKYYSNNVCLFKELKFLKLKDIHKFYACVYMYKILNSNECPTLSNDMCLDYRNHPHNTRNRHTLIVPFPRVNSVLRNYEYQFIKLWNELPERITNQTSLRLFKRKLQLYYIEFY